jgi:heptosyltransferase I
MFMKVFFPEGAFAKTGETMAVENAKISKILVFQLNWMGDILFSYPLLRALAGAFPEAEISCAVVPGYAQLLEGNPWVRSVIEIPEKRGFASLAGNLAFARRIRKEKFDVCFFLKPSRTKSIMAVAAGIKERIGPRGKKAFLTTSVEVPEGKVHRADQILSLAGALGITKADGTYEYSSTSQDKERAGIILRSAGAVKGRRVVLNPGGNWPAKRWPKEHFVELAGKILKRFNDIDVVITGAPKDICLAEEITSETGSGRCCSVAGKTDMNTLAAIFAGSELVVSADSGPLHLASAAGAATVGIFGPTSPEITGQRGKRLNVVIKKPAECPVPCYSEKCGKGYKCMASITPEDVFRSVEDILSR